MATLKRTFAHILLQHLTTFIKVRLIAIDTHAVVEIMTLSTSQTTDLFSHARLVKEYKTIKAMINIYCRAHHQGDEAPCESCDQLLRYAHTRLMHCPFQHNKPTCGNCLIHCYKPDMKDKIINVMRFSGPRMIYHHPLMALRHMLDNLKKPQDIRRRKAKRK